MSPEMKPEPVPKVIPPVAFEAGFRDCAGPGVSSAERYSKLRTAAPARACVRSFAVQIGVHELTSL